jgi:two-component sensor histidine kinase
MEVDDGEALRREAEHRTKNTLQLISSIVMLQGRRTADPAAQAALKSVLQRIAAVSLAHRHVHAEQVELSALVRELAADITRANGRDGLSVELALEPVTVPARDGAPVALILNEALGNALHHGFGDGRPGRVDVALRRLENGFEISVTDDGVGLSATPNGFGSTIVQLMAQQLKGRLTTTPQPGCRIAVTVPMEAPPT